VLVPFARNKCAALKLMRKLLKKYHSPRSGSPRTTCGTMTLRLASSASSTRMSPDHRKTIARRLRISRADEKCARCNVSSTQVQPRNSSLNAPIFNAFNLQLHQIFDANAPNASHCGDESRRVATAAARKPVYRRPRALFAWRRENAHASDLPCFARPMGATFMDRGSTKVRAQRQEKGANESI
jgi:hypothetical protein